MDIDGLSLFWLAGWEVKENNFKKNFALQMQMEFDSRQTLLDGNHKKNIISPPWTCC